MNHEFILIGGRGCYLDITRFALSYRYIWHMKMVRKPTFAGKIDDKDKEDILFWATQKTPGERLAESWRLHCLNHGLSPDEVRLDRTKSSARKHDA